MWDRKPQPWSPTIDFRLRHPSFCLRAISGLRSGQCPLLPQSDIGLTGRDDRFGEKRTLAGLGTYQTARAKCRTSAEVLGRPS